MIELNKSQKLIFCFAYHDVQTETLPSFPNKPNLEAMVYFQLFTINCLERKHGSYFPILIKSKLKLRHSFLLVQAWHVKIYYFFSSSVHSTKCCQL